jgi:signal peptidase I
VPYCQQHDVAEASSLDSVGTASHHSAFRKREYKEKSMARRGEKKAEKTETPEEEKAKKSKLREIFESLIVAIILALFVKTFVVQTFQIPTGSMEDGLLIGDHIIVNKLIYGPVLPLIGQYMPMRDVKRGDVVVFKYPDDPREDYVKRVIGMPGEEVKIFRHQIWINGTPIEQLGMDEDSYTLRWRRADSERAAAIGYDPDEYTPDVYDRDDVSRYKPVYYHVPEGHYFMMGDHRFISQDGRAWQNKYVPRDYIVGRAMIIYWSQNATRADYRQGDLFGQLGAFARAIITFPFNTRWGRLLHIVH